MFKRKTLFAQAILAIVILPGCASFDAGAPSRTRVDYLPTHIRVIEKENVASFCVDNRATLGCMVRLRETNQCIVFVKSGLPRKLHGEVISGETNRCFFNAASPATSSAGV
jgi:hypothetical protein